LPPEAPSPTLLPDGWASLSGVGGGADNLDAETRLAIRLEPACRFDSHIPGGSVDPCR